MTIELIRKPVSTSNGGELSSDQELTYRVGDGKSFSLDGSYVPSSVNNHIFKVSRQGFAVSAALGYSDSPISMYFGTITNHPLHFRTNNTKVGDISSAGAWTLGAAAGAELHQINGNARFETSGATNQAVIIRSGSTATLNDIQFYAANSAANTAKNRIFAEIVAAQDSGATPVFQNYVGRDTNAAITTRPLWSWINFTTERGRVDADGTWRNTAGTWSTLSDSRLKTNVQTLAGALDLITALRPVTFDWINAAQHDISPKVSFLAQEVEAVRAEWVSNATVDGDDAVTVGGSSAKQLTMGYDMQAYLVAAIKEFKQQFDDYVASHP